MGDPGKRYCWHRARPDGTMRFYDEMLEALVAFLAGFEGLPRRCARDMAESVLAEMPAWISR